MIVGMVQHEAPAAARKLYGQMLAKSLVPNSRTLTYIVLSLVSCARYTRLTMMKFADEFVQRLAGVQGHNYKSGIYGR